MQIRAYISMWTTITTLTLASAMPTAFSTPTVTLKSGILIGTQSSVSEASALVNQYLGIPFAASPTRFAPPQTPTAWSQPLRATQRGPACIQQFNYPESARDFSLLAFNTPPPEESEDCLNLNVFTPAGAEDGKERLKPVLFWIYGGGLQMGWNGVSIYDGSSFAAKQDVILVAPNYRATSLPVAERNLGFLDQRLALQWTVDNIASFGGNPNLITIFGESGGAYSVDALLNSYNVTTRPPFAGAITQSDCPQVDDLECARAIPAETLKSMSEHLVLNWWLTADNATYFADGNKRRRRGQIYPTPLLTGTNAADGSIFVSAFNNTANFLSFAIPGISESQILQVQGVYPIGSYSAAGTVISNEAIQVESIYTDLVFQCPSAIVANTSRAQSIPTWRYYYNSSFPNIELAPGYGAHTLGVYHSSEIPLVFGTYDQQRFQGNGGPSDEERRLSEYMQAAWATFARNPAGGPGWTEVASAKDGYVQVIGGAAGFGGSIDEPVQAVSASVLEGERCKVWEAIYQATTGV